ncbi:hypothetical protein EVAR_91192_1 [Eumeta japonica]|uniref:Uncharacterized protein n=1 Tax=Eumeta variegata TaxID=151549 RepID=A0A4C1ZK41_EUMVA|nr:hypothetical protein EVAR_91192_1 [Eumeta japonica]
MTVFVHGRRPHTVADARCGRTCRPVALDNLGSREYDRYREHLRQLTMPSRSRPMPTGANAGRPACVSAVEHARRVPDRPARHGTAAAMDVRNTGAAALRAQRTLNVADAARLPRCGRGGACPDVAETISSPRKLDSLGVYVNTDQHDGSGSLTRVALTATVGCMDSLISGRRRARLDLRGAGYRCVLS